MRVEDRCGGIAPLKPTIISAWTSSGRITRAFKTNDEIVAVFGSMFIKSRRSFGHNSPFHKEQYKNKPLMTIPIHTLTLNFT